MDTYAQRIYLGEAATQCRFAINAARALDNVVPRWFEALNAENDGLAQTLHDEIFRSLHSLLTHSSNVSKLFWPAPPRRKSGESQEAYASRKAANPKNSRAEELRQAVGLPETGHVLCSRKLRDHLEHFDERLDEWQARSPRRNYFHDTIGVRAALHGVDDCDIMRWYDPNANHLLFRGDTFEIPALVAAVEEVSAACHRALSTPSQRVRHGAPEGKRSGA